MQIWDDTEKLAPAAPAFPTPEFRTPAFRAIVDGLAPMQGPTAALRVQDQALRLQLECVLDRAPEAQADVLVIELATGEALLPGAGDPPHLLVLSDDPAIVADRALAGVLPRSASARQIAAAVFAVSEGLLVRPPAAPAIPGRAPVLTPREGEILARIGEGMSNKAIARRLGISAHTVKYHLEAVFAKLAVRSRAEAVSQGVRRGLVHL